MGLTSALNTSLNGLTLNETTIDVVGNNIANAGTNGFKASKALFATQLSRTLSVGSSPSGTNGGTNPRQVGLGATTVSISKDFSQGSITNSTSPSDLAIQGDGFFIVDGPDGPAYTRDGGFQLNLDNDLVNSQGFRVQGYGVDAESNILTTNLANVNIPVGALNVAVETENVSITGAILTTGEVATQGAHILSEALTNTSGGSATTNPIVSTTLLTSVFEDGSTTALFTNGQVVSFSGNKGGRTTPPESLTVTATTTVADLLTLIDDTLGITSTGTPTIPNDPNKLPAPGLPGVDVVNGQIQITGNTGTANDLLVGAGDLTVDGTSVPIVFTKDQAADGESAVTDFVVFDSLGQEVAVRMATVLESTSNTASNVRWYLDSVDDSDANIELANGHIVFDGEGNVTSGGTATFAIDRALTAAFSPMQITLDMTAMSGLSTPTAGSSISLQSQDGSAPGTLTSFGITETGVINGIFDNGISRTLGQIALARFANPQGLLEAGANTFREGVGSGPPFVVSPGSFGGGTIRSGAIELSNTDVGRNLVELIVASTNYRGNARVISSVQELVDELLVLGR